MLIGRAQPLPFTPVSPPTAESIRPCICPNRLRWDRRSDDLENQIGGGVVDLHRSDVQMTKRIVEQITGESP